jgi:hypothetical protein
MTSFKNRKVTILKRLNYHRLTRPNIGGENWQQNLYIAVNSYGEIVINPQ